MEEHDETGSLRSSFRNLRSGWLRETQRATDTTVAAAKAQVNPTLSTSDASFMTTGARGGMAEVNGQLAQQNSRSVAVRRFGQQMVDDHGRANQQMMTLAQQKQITPPSGIGAEQQQMTTSLGYAVVHSTAPMPRPWYRITRRMSAYQDEALNGTDPDVKAFAARHVPILQEHLRMAQRLPQR